MTWTESGFLVGLMIGMTVGIFLTRWLWINGQKAKRKRLKAEKQEANDDIT